MFGPLNNVDPHTHMKPFREEWANQNDSDYALGWLGAMFYLTQLCIIIYIYNYKYKFVFVCVHMYVCVMLMFQNEVHTEIVHTM